MKVSKIIYFGTYPVGAYWQKIGLEAEIIEGDDVRQSLYALKKQVDDFHYESTKAAEKEAEKEKILQVPPYNVIAAPLNNNDTLTLIQHINSCTEFKVLESYYLIVKKDPDLQHAYDLKKEELKNKEIKQILEKTNAKTKSHDKK